MTRIALWIAVVLGSLTLVGGAGCGGDEYICIAYTSCSFTSQLTTMSVNATSESDAKSQCSKANGGTCCTCRKK